MEKIKLIHILNKDINYNTELFNNINYITYIQYQDNIFFIHNLLKLLNKNEKFIIFYELYRKNIETCIKLKYKLEKFIKSITEDYNNVKIIYITNITDNTLEYSKNIKVLNIFITNKILYSKFIKKDFILNKSYISQNKTRQSTHYFVSIPKIKHNNVYIIMNDNYRFENIENFKNSVKQFKFKFISLNTENSYEIDLSSSVESFTFQVYNWLKKYIYETKIIGFGRLIQHVGTCWFNSIINGMLLSHNYKKILYDTYNCHIELMNTRKIFEFNDFELKDIQEKKISIKNCLLKLIETIIINKKDINENHEDFVSYMASLVKLHYYGKENKYINDNNINNFVQGGYVSYAIKSIYKILYPEGLYLIKMYNEKIIRTHQYNPIIITLLMHTTTDENIMIEDYIEIFNEKYYIENCTLLINYNHSIAGFKTINNEYYIYDSHNELLKIDWRNLNNFKDYMFHKNIKKISFETITFCVER